MVNVHGILNDCDKDCQNILKEKSKENRRIWNLIKGDKIRNCGGEVFYEIPRKVKNWSDCKCKETCKENYGVSRLFKIEYEFHNDKIIKKLIKKGNKMFHTREYKYDDKSGLYVFKDGKILFNKRYGEVDIDDSLLVKELDNNEYRIWSIGNALVKRKKLVNNKKVEFNISPKFNGYIDVSTSPKSNKRGKILFIIFYSIIFYIIYNLILKFRSLNRFNKIES